MNHPDTIIHSYWFSKDAYINNIPQPSYISVNVLHAFSTTIPNIFIQIEPNIIQDHKCYLLENYSKYHTILTFDKDVLDKCPNSRFIIVCSSWIKPDYYNNIDTSKKEYKISTLSGSKCINNSSGHIFRQTIHNNQQHFSKYPITFFRSSVQYPHLIDYGNNPFIGEKEDLFDTFQFAIIIENTTEINNFSEKIIDCLITKTIPIYYGCSNIDQFFDTTGWIILKSVSIEELQSKLEILDSNYYNKYVDIIQKNYTASKEYVNIYDNINKSLSNTEYHVKYTLNL
jgi:hypothetical protein